MRSEDTGIAAFLRAAGWDGATRTPLAGDASNRRYERLTAQDTTAVLMIAGPESAGDTHRFLAIARHLSENGFSAPAILEADPDAGLLLIEDLGDDLYARRAAGEPNREAELYRTAVDVLAVLHTCPVPQDVPDYGIPRLIGLADPGYVWYAGKPVAPAFRDAFESLLTETPDLLDVLILRDYHAENLLWLPMRTGIRRAGLLDFQDAMRGHRAYDLVSLLEDARRDVPETLQASMIAHYLAATGIDETAFRHAFALLGVQRNLRILGIFARLALRDGKPQYLDLIPRVWRHLRRDLSHPDLSRLRDIVLADIPDPTPIHLDSLKARCAATPQ